LAEEPSWWLIRCSDIGANASAEEADEGVEDQAIKVNNIVHSFRLQSTQYDKKQYLVHLKGTYSLFIDHLLSCQSLTRFFLSVAGYMKNLKTKLQEAGKSEEEIKDFETKAQAFAKKVIANFKDWEFYTGESMDPDAM
jgi:hypothetical protein